MMSSESKVHKVCKDYLHQLYRIAVKLYIETIPSYPTDIQAEVLYPGPLSLEHLLKIYVKNSESKKLIDAQLMTLHQQYEVIISPENFNA